MHICVGNLTIVGADNCLSPSKLQAIICTNPGILLIRPLGTNFSGILISNQNSSIFIQENAFEKVVCKKVAILSQPQCDIISAIGSASGSRDFTRFGPGGSTLLRFPCKTPIGKVGTSQYTFVTKKLA